MAHSFARPKPRFKPQSRILVLCEDTKSCLDYLNDAARHFRAYADVEIVHCGHTHPQGIVAEAVKRKAKYDHVYCAIDRDSHERFDEALQIASAYAAKITVITSYPCYEFWLYLHFKKSRSPYAPQGKRSAADCVVKDLCLQPGMQDYDKGAAKNLFAQLLPQLPRARQNAVEVMQDAVAERDLNPSTRLHELIAKFEALGVVQPVK